MCAEHRLKVLSLENHSMVRPPFIGRNRHSKGHHCQQRHNSRINPQPRTLSLNRAILPVLVAIKHNDENPHLFNLARLSPALHYTNAFADGARRSKFSYAVRNRVKFLLIDPTGIPLITAVLGLCWNIGGLIINVCRALNLN